ncbi:hypothetical protein F4808DRAFT_282557 [Astrocystis sublimbata]|nr:hypothetical protein F4808DRAFT_282557 [Astrocystis sublimbata]
MTRNLGVDSLLNNGYWSSSRARTPDLNNIRHPYHNSSYSSSDDEVIPSRRACRHDPRKPPPPIVEDENDALAKEAGSVVSSVPSEEPTNRGDPDQLPILLPVQEHNPERRFVLVPNESDLSPDPKSGVSVSEERQSQYRRPAAEAAEPDTEPTTYQANTRRSRKQDALLDRKDKAAKEDVRPEIERRRSRPADLPPIITDGEGEGWPNDNRRAKSTTRTDHQGEGYFSPHFSSASSRVAREGLLTPEVTEHATNGRDRSYHKGGLSAVTPNRDRSAHPSDQKDRSSRKESRYEGAGYRPTHPPSPTLERRRTSDVSKQARRDSKESYDPRLKFERPSPRSDRRAPSFTYSPIERHSGSQRSASKRDARAPPTYGDTFYSSEDEPRLPTNSRRPGSAIPPGKIDLLTTPGGSRGPSRRQSRGQSSLPSPRLSQSSLSDAYDSSSSTRSSTFPRETVPSRGEDRDGRTLPRASTAKDSSSAVWKAVPTLVSATTAIPSASNRNAMVDPRRVMAPSAPKAGPVVDSRVPSSTPSVSTPLRTSWPPRFEPSQNGGGSNHPIGSYRRFSTEVKTGDLPDIPHCSRTREEAGHMDWLTLPRCDNFNICPSCYSANFASTEFAHEFVLMPFRRRDQPIACDFGASEFYRIAWLFTRKYGRRDLGLFHSLTKIAATSQPCSGHRQASRTWYSIRDPSTKRCIDGFTVCDACAAAVEALLPSLSGLFAHLDSPSERKRGVCAMHHDRGHDRGRFLLYFDVLEGAADRALETQSAPDGQALADRIRKLAAIPPCGEGRASYDGYWHTMRDVPVVVCHECFMMVVQPLLDGRGDLTVAGNFHHGVQYKKKAECMLFSDRMRNVFNRAVMKKDLAYLTDKIHERNRKKEECDGRLDALQRQGLSSPWAVDETERVVRDWKRYE